MLRNLKTIFNKYSEFQILILNNRQQIQYHYYQQYLLENFYSNFYIDLKYRNIKNQYFQLYLNLKFNKRGDYLVAGTKSQTSIIIHFKPTHVTKCILDNSACQQIRIVDQDDKKSTIFSANISGTISKTTTQLSLRKNIINKKVSTHPLTCIAINNKNNLIAISQTDRYIKLYTDNFEFIKTIECHTNWVNYVDFSQSGDKLVSCSDDETITITDMNTYRQLSKITQAEGLLVNIKQAKFINDQEIIVIGFQECQIWNWQDKTLLQHYTLSTVQLSDVCTTYNGNYGFVACQDGIKILDLIQGRIIFNIKADSSITAVDISYDGSTLACGLEDGRILIFELKFDQY